MYSQMKTRVDKAISALASGKGIILLDDNKRENEGDIIFPAQSIDADKINFMLQHTSGIICLTITQKHAAQLQLEPMVPYHLNTSRFTTGFTVSIEAATGVTTGVSAKDRTRTIQVASNPNAKPEDINKPGHIFPLIAHKYGVLGRPGHTEGSIDLTTMAKLHPTAVLCELMHQDGTMMKDQAIEDFAKQYNFPIVHIEDIYHYRLANESLVEKAVTTEIRFKDYGLLDMSVLIDPITQRETIVLSKNIADNPVVRIHSSCTTGDLFGSLQCDCQSQLHHALQTIAKSGGLLIYLDQEGRNIGLVNKLKAYELQRTKKLNTIEANQALNLPVDNRHYDLAIQILKYFNIDQCRLLSNNPEKIKSLGMANIKATMQPSVSKVHSWNKAYLQIKKSELKHNIQGVE